MKSFLEKHSNEIVGVLSGFDRLVFRGNLLRIVYADGLKQFLYKRKVLFKEFKTFAKNTSKELKEASCSKAHQLQRPVKYLSSSKTSKEDTAREIAEKDNITEGLIAVLSCVEPCNSFTVQGNPQTQKLELVSKARKGLALYHYFIDPIFGFMHARIQTWLPFGIQICMNGREWLSRQMDRAGISYERRDNCFVSIENMKQAQTLMNRQVKKNFPSFLDRIAKMLNPAHNKIFKDFPLNYYWSTHQSEWASDVMFKDIASLQEIYPSLILHGMKNFSSPDVMRFLGRKVHGAFKGEIISDFKNRAEGVRIKHRSNGNSVKMYDKWNNLRVETTINQPDQFKVFRPLQGDEDGELAWLPMRRGVADIHRRTQVSQASNERYLEALAPADTSTPLGDLVKKICQPAFLNNKRVRALRPWDPEDTKLFEVVTRGEFAINGFRNRDLQKHLYDSEADSQKEKRRRSAKVSRLLRMLRAHGLIKQVPHSHRYMLTVNGRNIISAILTSQRVSIDQIEKLAA